ncbi:MAG: DNA internalization-related competence protein ComEC/Rec2 [Deinococcales bacterium]
MKLSHFLNFPVLGALGVVFGVLLERQGLPFWTAFAFAVFALPTLWLPRAIGLALFAALLLAPLGWWRSHVTRAVPDNLEPFVDKEITLSGRFDGRFLQSDSNTVLLRSSTELELGGYRVTGKLERPTWYRNPGTFDLGAWMAARGAKYVLRAKDIQSLPSTLLDAVRSWVRTGVRTGLQTREAALMTGIALGDPDELNGMALAEETRSWRDVFAASGLAHIMALSGQQVTILVLMLSVILRRLRLWRFAVLSAILLGYWAVVGASPSVSRAILMGLAVLLAAGLGRGRLEVLPAIGLSAIFTLLWQPAWLADLGWLLSYLAVLGMVFFIPPTFKLLGLTEPQETNPHLPWIFRYLTLARARYWAVAVVVTTLAAQTLTTPLIASSFGQIALISPISNLFSELLMLPLVVLSFVAGILGQFGFLVNWLVQPLAWLMLEGAQLFAGVPVLEWGMISATGYITFYATLGAVYAALVGWIRPYQMLMVLLGAIIVTALPTRNRAEVIYLDVGQGDSTLIRLPVGDILIDGGGTPRSSFDIGARVVVPALRALGVRVLTVIATHGDADHIEGLNAVLRHFRVSSLIIGDDKVSGEDAVWDELMQTAKVQNIPIRTVARGMDWRLGEAQIRFLHPAPPYARDDDNKNSVAFVLEYANRRLLFLGDAPSEVEESMNPGKLDVFKLAHHGSRFSSSTTLLRRTQPNATVISSGSDNTYGHPSAAVLERLKLWRPKVFRTDRDGAIIYSLKTGGFRTFTQDPQAGSLGVAGTR